MSRSVSNIIFGLLVVGLLLGYAFQDKITNALSSGDEFSLSQISFESLIGHETTIPEGMGGYVVFYSDLKGCTSCMDELRYLKDLSEQFDDIGIFSVLKQGENRQAFGELMSSYEVPGDYLVDSNNKLQRSLSLSNNPRLMFFNRRGEMVANLALNVDHDSTKRLFFRYMEEL